MQPLDATGKIFTILFIFAGVGTTLYALSVLIETFIGHDLAAAGAPIAAIAHRSARQRRRQPLRDDQRAGQLPDLFIVSRVGNESNEAGLVRGGANRVVNPQRIGGARRHSCYRRTWRRSSDSSGARILAIRSSSGEFMTNPPPETEFTAATC